MTSDEIPTSSQQASLLPVDQQQQQSSLNDTDSYISSNIDSPQGLLSSADESNDGMNCTASTASAAVIIVVDDPPVAAEPQQVVVGLDYFSPHNCQ